LTIDPLGSDLIYTQSGTLQTPGEPIDWVEFTFFNTRLPMADYNSNRRVDAADYVVWRKGLRLRNEVLTLGATTSHDYSAWRARYGMNATDFYISSIEILEAADTGIAESVPEAETGAYLSTALVALFAARLPGSCPECGRRNMM
jgi:hypothetical protein